MIEELAGRKDVGLAGKELIDQAVMQFFVKVSATVLEDDDAVVGVGSFEECGENHTTGGDTEEDEGMYVVGAEDHFEVGACEGTDAVLGDDDVGGIGSDGGMNCSRGALKQLLVSRRGLDRAHKEIARADLREIRAEADLHVDDAHPGGTRALEDAGGTDEEFIVLHVDGDDAGLHVHAEDGGAGGLEGESGRHDGSLLLGVTDEQKITQRHGVRGEKTDKEPHETKTQV